MDGGASLLVFTALSAASSVMSGISSYVQGKDAKEAADREADSALNAARYNDQLRQMKLKRLIGRNLAEVGAGGSMTRSDMSVIAENVALSELQGDIDIYNARVQSMQIRARGLQMYQQGKSGFLQGLIGAGTSIGMHPILSKEYDFYTKSNKFGDVRTDMGKTPGVPFFKD